MKLTGENLSTWRKACPSATFSTTNPTWTDPGSNPGLRGETAATNRLSHGTAYLDIYIEFNENSTSNSMTSHDQCHSSELSMIFNTDIKFRDVVTRRCLSVGLM
jgi:hypothetical protein